MKAVIFFAVALSLVIAPAEKASASCIRDERTTPQQITEADSVFVGTVDSVSNRNRTATFRVEEVWKGGPMPGKATVKGGPESGMATSIDRTFQQGARYLVFPEGPAPAFTDNSCSPTRGWDINLARYRPADVASKLETGSPQATVRTDRPDGLPVSREGGRWVLPAVLGAMLASGAVWLIVKRRRIPGSQS